MAKNRAAVSLGRRGGQATARKYDAEHFRRIRALRRTWPARKRKVQPVATAQ